MSSITVLMILLKEANATLKNVDRDVKVFLEEMQALRYQKADLDRENADLRERLMRRAGEPMDAGGLFDLSSPQAFPPADPHPLFEPESTADIPPPDDYGLKPEISAATFAGDPLDFRPAEEAAMSTPVKKMEPRVSFADIHGQFFTHVLLAFQLSIGEVPGEPLANHVSCIFNRRPTASGTSTAQKEGNIITPQEFTRSAPFLYTHAVVSIPFQRRRSSEARVRRRIH